MDPYIKQLEGDNDSLREALAKSQEKAEEYEYYYDLFKKSKITGNKVKVWYKDMHDEWNNENGEIHSYIQFENHFCATEVLYRSGNTMPKLLTDKIQTYLQECKETKEKEEKSQNRKDKLVKLLLITSASILAVLLLLLLCKQIWWAWFFVPQ